jgi:hypothetical protein
MPQARRQQPRFRIVATLGGSTCLRDARPQRFCRLRAETAGTREKSKSLPHNKFTHVNAPAASGIPAAPYLGMTCQPPPHAKHGQVLTFNVPTPSRNRPPHRLPHALIAQHSPRFRVANRWSDRPRKARLIGGLIGGRKRRPIGSGSSHESGAQRTTNRIEITARIGATSPQ